MALLPRLRVYLDQNRTGYTHTVHPQAFTAREVASVEHLPAREFAKTVILSGDPGYSMAVVPGARLVDFQEVRLALGFSHARLATEAEIAQLFPDCELGAMPPFGNLYGLPVFLDSYLAGEPVIAFNAGTHRDVIHMRTEDYRRLVRPSIVSLAREAAARHGW
jgi:Ala-tRNA(Pro) deacylase